MEQDASTFASVTTANPSRTTNPGCSIANYATPTLETPVTKTPTTFHP